MDTVTRPLASRSDVDLRVPCVEVTMVTQPPSPNERTAYGPTPIRFLDDGPIPFL